MAPRKARSCPVCGARMIPIAYGFPSGEMFEQAERGEVVLGGCLIDPANPENVCVGDPPHYSYPKSRRSVWPVDDLTD